MGALDTILSTVLIILDACRGSNGSSIDCTWVCSGFSESLRVGIGASGVWLLLGVYSIQRKVDGE